MSTNNLTSKYAGLCSKIYPSDKIGFDRPIRSREYSVLIDRWKVTIRPAYFRTQPRSSNAVIGSSLRPFNYRVWKCRVVDVSRRGSRIFRDYCVFKTESRAKNTCLAKYRISDVKCTIGIAPRDRNFDVNDPYFCPHEIDWKDSYPCVWDAISLSLSLFPRRSAIDLQSSLPSTFLFLYFNITYIYYIYLLHVNI